jgi:TatD DNase family protein
MDLVDICANLTHDAFDEDRAAVLERAREAGVGRLMITGADEAGSRQALALARHDPASLRATAGIHPHAAEHASAAVIETLRELAADPLVAAIGETGLDYNRDFSPREVQERLFEQQLALAAETGLPVFAHQRDAHERFMAILRPWREHIGRIVVHCFTGTEAELADYLALDCHIGVTGWICDERRGHHLREFIGRVPLERLMIETDAPYLLPRDLKPKPRSRRNEPAHLPHIAETVAAARGEALEALAAGTTATAERFFGL